ncbi:hypothetical protein GIX45_28310 [Erwinia sp. CPCC 100877]|nr:hypothetical protein [Erwinia sp. CPCC 100877]
MTDFVDIDRMTLSQYNVRMTANKLAELNKLRNIHEQAWANNQIKSSKLVGKKTVPIYDRFEKFFDYDKYKREILGLPTNVVNDKASNLLLKANS